MKVFLYPNLGKNNCAEYTVEACNILRSCGIGFSVSEKYKDVFEYVDIINGTIVSIGTHPSGVLISDLPIDELVGLCSLSTSDYPVSMINMKELDDLMYVKLSNLGWLTGNGK